MPTGVVYVGDARLKTHYPHGQMHVVALLVRCLGSPRLPGLQYIAASDRLRCAASSFVVPSPVRSTRPKVLLSVIIKTRLDLPSRISECSSDYRRKR